MQQHACSSRNAMSYGDQKTHHYVEPRPHTQTPNRPDFLFVSNIPSIDVAIAGANEWGPWSTAA